MLRLPRRSFLRLALSATGAGVVFQPSVEEASPAEGMVALEGGLDSSTQIEALAEWFRHHAVLKADMQVLVSSACVRYAIVPWQESRRSADEAMLAKACLEHRYGSMAGWEIRLDTETYGGSRLACAVPSVWLGGLRALADRFGLRCRDCLPLPVAVWNAWKPAADHSELIFALLEPDSVVFLTRRAGYWVSVHASRAAMNVPAFLLALQREAIVQGFDEPPVSYVFAPHLAEELRRSPQEGIHLIGAEGQGFNAEFLLALAKM
ncbi:MAG TPA: hypothetical protein PLW86_20390, partial [Rhodocyclaceae bacterium]|nr:hypothetical protein [Rhodocyclaceae bacterium]